MAADVWKKDVWDFQVFSQIFFELRFSLGNEGKDGKNLNSQTWPGSPRRPSPRHPQPPERVWESQMFAENHRCSQKTATFLGCRKWGFKRWGFKEIRGYLRKKAFFLRFLDFPGALQALRKRAKKAEKGRFRPISRKGGQTPLKPPFVTPPFAAAQILQKLEESETVVANKVAAIVPLSMIGTRYRNSVSTPWKPLKPTTQLGLN